MLWAALGISAMILTILHLVWLFLDKETKWLRYAALALTALTLCAFYQTNAVWAIKEDWSALMDVTPALSKILWGLTAASIVLNSFSLFRKPVR